MKTEKEILYEFASIRREVFKTNPRCAYCGKPAEELHHIVPRSRGGDNRPSNLIPLCYQCHCKAHDKSYARNGKKGRKKIELPSNFDIIADEYLSGMYSLQEVLIILNMSRSTFSTKLNEYKEKTGDNRDHSKEKIRRFGKLYIK